MRCLKVLWNNFRSLHRTGSCRWTAVAGLVGTLGSALAWNYSNTPISCSHEDSQTAKASKHADIKSLRAWLLNNGSELDAIDFRPSPEVRPRPLIKGVVCA